MRGFLLFALLLWTGCAQAQTGPVPVPMMAEDRNESDVAFRQWLGQFRKRALAQGITAEVFEQAFEGIRPKTSVIDKDRNQSEFSKQIWDYLDAAVSEERVTNGQVALAAHHEMLDRIEARYGVDKEVVVAVWGLETAYGTFRGDIPVIEALATLAFDPRRAAFFETQLLDALRILQAGDVIATDMRGSWAGAMGHTQFMPGSYLQHAQDFDGDGRRDIWGDDPVDALASTAAYLAHFGWVKHQPWGIEITLPKGFDYAEIATGRRPVREWLAMGVRGVDAAPLPSHPHSAILLPAGHQGAAFLTFDNFHVIEKYNKADAYVIGVGHLADRLRGGAALAADWPRDDRTLSFAERQEMQRLLLAKGFDPDGVDGLIGPNTIAAIRAFQRSVGMVPDGYASARLLQRLK